MSENKGISYKTKQRQIILNFLKNNKTNHITAEDIMEHLRDQNTPVGKSTIYRYLDILIKDNIVKKYTIDKISSACYQYISENNECDIHYHLRCTICGKLFHVQNILFNDISNVLLKDFDFKLDNSKTVLYGICKECQNKEK